MVRTDKREGVTIFQTYNILKLPIRVNTQRMEYYPILALNDFWSMDSELTQINKTENGFFTFRLYLSFNYIRNFMFNNMLGIQFNEQMMYEKLKISGTKDMLVELIRNNSTFYLINTLTNPMINPSPAPSQTMALSSLSITENMRRSVSLTSISLMRLSTILLMLTASSILGS